MAVTYLQLERLFPVGEVVVVDTDEALVFDMIVSSRGLGTAISYDTGTGTITFLEGGYYYIDWFVAPQFGLTTDGSNWAIQTAIGGLSIIGSSHTRVSVTTGFALLHVQANETARLVNVSDGALHLSQAVQAKAGLIVYGIAVMNLAVEHSSTRHD